MPPVLDFTAAKTRKCRAKLQTALQCLKVRDVQFDKAIAIPPNQYQMIVKSLQTPETNACNVSMSIGL
jgi:hypothetical protein